MNEKQQSPIVQSDFYTLRKSMIFTRYLARKAITPYHEALKQKRNIERHKRKLTEKGIAFPILDLKIKALKQEADKHRECIVYCGQLFFFGLDMWQKAGASLKDLCNLCNKPYHQAVEELEMSKDIKPDILFSDIMFVHNLDWVHDENAEFIPQDADMPISFCIKEFFFRQIKSNPEVKEKMHEAFEECFPEIAETAICPVTNAEGETVFFDRDGIEVDPSSLTW